MKNRSVAQQTTHQLQLHDIGTHLREMRETYGITLENAAEQTHIRASLLRAIEVGDMTPLPEPVYIRGLIHRYGNFLGLDGKALSIQFFTPVPPRRNTWKEATVGQLRPLHLYIVYVLVMLAAISGLSYLLRRTAPEIGNMPPLEPLTAQSEPSNSEPSNTNSLAVAPSNSLAPRSDHSIQVDMTLTAQSWLRVVSDGQTQFEGILQQGDSRSWTADERLTIRAGNAGGVVVRYNQGQSERLGEPGMVAEVTYAPTESVSLAF